MRYTTLTHRTYPYSFNSAGGCSLIALKTAELQNVLGFDNTHSIFSHIQQQPFSVASWLDFQTYICVWIPKVSIKTISEIPRRRANSAKYSMRCACSFSICSVKFNNSLYSLLVRFSASLLASNSLNNFYWNLKILDKF